MKKILIVACALAGIGFAPIELTSASAQDRIVIKRDGDRAHRTVVKKRIVVRERRPASRVTIIRREREPRRVVVRDRSPDRVTIIRRDRSFGRYHRHRHHD